MAGNSQAVFRVELWSGSTIAPVDRALAEVASPGPAPRNAESWSRALRRGERTQARVDIRGSKPSERVTPRRVVRLAAGLVACVALVVAAAPVARGDPGASNGNGAANSASSSSPNQEATSDPADTPDSTAADDPSAPAITGQSADANAHAGQTGAKNDNSALRDGQNGQNGPVAQGNNASASATSNGNANGNGNGNANRNGNTNGNGNGNANGSGNGNANGHASATAAQDTPTNTNVAVRVGSPGDIGTIDQSNSAQSGATAGGTGATDTPPATTGNGASSTAAADVSQTTPANTNVDVRVGSSGDSGPVTQTNSSQASAGAASAGAGSASATSSQTSPTNLNVTIRVGSPGDNGVAHQSNSVEATAGPSNSHDSSAHASQPSPGAETDQTVTTSGSAEVTNASDLDQTIEQGGDSDPSSPQVEISSNPTGSASGALVGSANAAQTDALNLNLSIRIGSPGTDGSVTQRNGAKAMGTSADLGLVTVTGGRNTTVTLVIPGAATAAPGDGPWTWNWVWNGDWTLPPGAAGGDVAATAGALWSWVWASPSQTSAAPAAAVATPAAVGQPDGTWTWTWTWKLPNGQIWNGGWQQRCDCNWTWTWSWDWSTGAPKSIQAQTTADSVALDPASAPTGSDIGPVSQQNVATATATASATTLVVQTLDQSQVGGGENQVVSADQTLLHGQEAIAAAEADQTDAWNLSLIRGIATGPVSQTNEVTADALASASESIVQSTVQHQTGNDTTEQSATAGQVLAGSQSALAVALAGQTDARNMVFVSGPSPNGRVSSVEQRNSASTTAAAVVSATLEQSIAQYQSAGSSLEQAADATQTLDNAQSAHTAAVVGQTSTWNLAEIVVPAASQATNPTLRQQNLVSATVSTNDSSDVVQRIIQSQDGIADIEVASASQDGAVGQQALAFAPAQQTRLLNRSGWLGIEPTIAPSAPPAAGAPPELPSPPAATAAASALSDGTTVSLITGGLLSARIAPSAPLKVPSQQQLPSLGTPTLGGPGHAATVSAVTAIESGVSSGTELQSALASARSGTPGGTSSPRQDGGNRGGDAGVVLLLSPGAASPATHGGAGAFGLAGRAFKLVAPAHLGPQSPAPTLGRSVAFSEPIERPG